MISWTQLQCFARCPRAYYLRYVAGLRLPTPFRFIEGQAYHKTFEHAGRELIEGRRAAAADLVDRFVADLEARLAAEEVDGHPDDAAAAKDAGLVTVPAYCADVYPTLRPRDVERRFLETWTLDDGTQTGFCGVVDVVEDNRILDYKVSAANRQSARDAATSPQLLLYADALGAANVGFVVVRPSKYAPLIQSLVAAPDDTARRNVRLWARRTASALLACRAANVWPVPPMDNWNCSPKWCEYFSVCFATPLTGQKGVV